MELVWAAPSLIVGLLLSTRFKPSVSFIVTMGVFLLTVYESRIFSFNQLLSSIEGIGFLAAETLAALIVTGVITLRSRRPSTF
jgi:hypothetical protein